MLSYRLAFYLLLISNVAAAVTENGTGSPATVEEGTGSPTVQLVVDQNQRIVLAVQAEGMVLEGSQMAESGYAELVLDAFLPDQTLLPDAARAAVLVRCGEADVVVYYRQQDSWVEYSSGTVAVEACIE